jgi:hypothetical protein
VPPGFSVQNRSVEIIVDIATDSAGRLSGSALSPELEESHAFSGAMEFLACIEMLCRGRPDGSIDPQSKPPESTNSVKGPLRD